MKRGTVLIFVDEYRSIAPALLDALSREMRLRGDALQLKPYNKGDMRFSSLLDYVPEPSYKRPRNYKDVPFWSRK